jgi:ribosomal protein S18 acetylase RimI-like enzyme
MTRIRKLGAEEGMLYKQLRLGALKESPDAFSPTWKESSIHEDQYWMDSARRIAESDELEIFVVEYEDKPVGLVSGQIDEERIGHIGAMWVDPKIRGKGVGKLLLSHVVAYLQERDCKLIELTVTESNLSATQLYLSIGFAFTGNDVPLRDGSDLLNREMTLKRG